MIGCSVNSLSKEFWILERNQARLPQLLHTYGLITISLLKQQLLKQLLSDKNERLISQLLLFPI
jgi:hypothetical protein